VYLPTYIPTHMFIDIPALTITNKWYPLCAIRCNEHPTCIYNILVVGHVLAMLGTYLDLPNLPILRYWEVALHYLRYALHQPHT